MKLFFLIAILISGTVSAEPLFYFHVGAEWTYQVKGSTSRSVTNSVSEVRTINGKNWYKLIEYGEAFWVGNSDKGQVEAVNFFEDNPQQLDEPEERLIFKYPAKVGETWDNVESPTTYQGVTTVTVPAGTFECHIYFIDMGGGNYSKSCIAVNVGVIYNEAVLDSGAKEVAELVSYEQ